MAPGANPNFRAPLVFVVVLYCKIKSTAAPQARKILGTCSENCLVLVRIFLLFSFFNKFAAPSNLAPGARAPACPPLVTPLRLIHSKQYTYWSNPKHKLEKWFIISCDGVRPSVRTYVRTKQTDQRVKPLFKLVLWWVRRCGSLYDSSLVSFYSLSIPLQSFNTILVWILQNVY